MKFAVPATDGLIHICYVNPDTEGQVFTECGISTMDGHAVGFHYRAPGEDLNNTVAAYREDYAYGATKTTEAGVTCLACIANMTTKET